MLAAGRRARATSLPGRSRPSRWTFTPFVPALILLSLVTYLAYHKIQVRRSLQSTAVQQGNFANQSEQFALVAGKHVGQLQQLQHDIQVLQQQLIDKGKPAPGGYDEANLACRPLAPPGSLRATQQHKAAVIFPHRDRDAQLQAAIAGLHSFLQEQGRRFNIFVLQQSPRLRFNRGALLNAGALLLAGSEYDHFIFHDVDTLPQLRGNIPYTYPAGTRPLHMTPKGLHPRVNYEDFFGGITIFTPQQLRAVGGYGTNFWGWGREDDNMRMRLQRAGLWPPEQPDVPKRGRMFYFRHTSHAKAGEVRVHTDGEAAGTTFEINPDKPFQKDLIVSSQPGILDDFHSGLNNTMFSLVSVQPVGELAVRFTVDLFCDRTATPWCEDGQGTGKG